jgi:hypothetical protein
MVNQFYSWSTAKLCELTEKEISQFTSEEIEALHQALIIRQEKVEAVLLDLGVDPKMLMSQHKVTELEKFVNNLEKLNKLYQILKG